MPNHSRCPQCNAAVPHRADWCSLCHADLRPEPVPQPALVTHGPAAGREPRTPAHAAAGGRHRRVDQPVAEAPVDAPPVPVVAPIGRHAAAAPAPAHAAAAGGTVALAGEVEALVADAPVGADGKPDLDLLTDQLMARLQSSERRGGAIPDVDSIPGGKWGLLLGGMAALCALLVAVMALAGKLLG